MKDFTVVVDWRSRYFGLPTQPPRRTAPSDEMEATRRLMERETERDAHLAAEWQQHARELVEREQIEKWRDAVEEHGSAAVERIVKHADPSFRLPQQLRGIEPRITEEAK
jgi:nucleotide-binding universal stress UspA family protein